MSLHHASARHRRGGPAAATLVAALVWALVGCSADDGGDDGRGNRMDASLLTDAALDVDATVTRVHGDLSTGARRALERETSRLLGRYLKAAYLHRREGRGYQDAFPGFTQDARELALADATTASNAAFKWAEDVRPLDAVAYVSVVAPEGRPVGATARVVLRLAASGDDQRREVAVRGRLLLTPSAEQWRIFGYDLSVASTPMRRS